MYKVLGGGFGGGRTPGRRAKDGVQGDDGIFHGGDDGGRSQGGDRRGLEQEEPGETQTAAMMEPHGGADGGRSHGGGEANDSMGPTDGGGAGGGRVRGGDGEPMILGDTEDPEGPGGAQGSGDQGGEGDPETGAKPKGRWSPVELVDRRATVETRELRDGVEPQGRRAEVESRTQRLKAEMRDPPAMTPMVTGRPAANPPHRWWAEAMARWSRRAVALRHRWVWSGTGEIIHGTGGERGSVSRQCPLHKRGEIRSRAVFGRRRSA
ncbi:hypothetical protein M9458_057546 [Cirrhinus mrigala]|uniref:Uncharacterized protein n=1 Tax=Cirrhinus mrigala TaxID=683832 RepID=A0ABD0MDH2_CIRMR